MPGPAGALGLDLAREHQPHVLVLDLDLPDMDGIEVLRRAKSDRRTRGIPVIVTADAISHRTEQALALGAERCLAKPLDVTELRSAIAAALGQEIAV